MNRSKLKEILKDNKKSFSVKRDNSDKIVDKYFIKELRLKRDYTQTVFASILGVSVKTIEKWEQGAIEPRPMVKKFLYLLDIHPVLFNDLYSFKSHEKTENQFVFYYSTNIAFTDEFKTKKTSEFSNDKFFKSTENKYITEVKTNNFLTEDCCPAS